MKQCFSFCQTVAQKHKSLNFSSPKSKTASCFNAGTKEGSSLWESADQLNFGAEKLSVDSDTCSWSQMTPIWWRRKQSVGLDIEAAVPQGLAASGGRHSGLGTRCYATWRGKSASARLTERWRWGNRSQVDAAEVNFASTWLRADEAFRWASEMPTSKQRRLISPGLAGSLGSPLMCFFSFLSSEQREENSLPDVQAALLIQIFFRFFSWQRIKMFPVSELCLIERNLWTPPAPTKCLQIKLREHVCMCMQLYLSILART